MQIVIDISEDEYDGIINAFYPNDYIVGALIYAVKNGTPLPKGHGRLIDVKKLIEKANESKNLVGELWKAPTIIEADTEDNENDA